MYGFNIKLARILHIDQDIISIYNNKNIKLFYKNLIDILLKYDQNIGKTKKHNHILKMTILGLESCIFFVTFINFDPIISVYQVQFDKLVILAKFVKELFD